MPITYQPRVDSFSPMPADPIIKFIPYVTWIACESLPKASALWQPGGRWEGRYDVYLWPIHIYVWQKQSQYCKGIILQLKWKNPQNKLTYRDSPCGLVVKNSPAKKKKKKKSSPADARDMDSIWSGEDPICCRATKPCAPKTEPPCCNYGSLHNLEPMLCNKRSHSNVKPANHSERVALTLY